MTRFVKTKTHHSHLKTATILKWRDCEIIMSCVYIYIHAHTNRGWVVSLNTGKHELSTYGLMSQSFRCITAVEKRAIEWPLVKSTVTTNEAQMVSVHL